VLLYFAAEKVLGAGGAALHWTNLAQVSDQLEPTILSLAFVFLVVGYGTRSAWSRSTTGFPTPTAKDPRRSQRSFPDSC